MKKQLYNITKKINKTIYDTEYLDKRCIDSYNPIMTVIVGPRGIGKSFGYKMDFLISSYENNYKMIYIVYTKEQVEELCANKGEKFFTRLIMELKKASKTSKRKAKHLSYFESYTTEEVVEIIKNGDIDTEIRKGKLYMSGKDVGYIISLNDFAKLKSNDFSEDYKFFLYDEFINENTTIRDLDNPHKLVSIIQTIARKRIDIKAVLIGNSVRLNDPILIALELDNLESGEIRIHKHKKTSKTILVAYRINPYNYPKYIENQKKSNSGLIAELFEEEQLDNNEFIDDVNTDLLIQQATREKSNNWLSIVGEGMRLKINTTKSGLWYVMEDYGKQRRVICIDSAFMDVGIIYQPDFREVFINAMRKNMLRYQSKSVYYKFRKILKLK